MDATQAFYLARGIIWKADSWMADVRENCSAIVQIDGQGK